jgi:hypothetical protein
MDLNWSDPTDLRVEWTPTPVEDEDGLPCAKCGQVLREEAYYDDGDGVHYCETCVKELIESLKGEAIAYAKEHCKITDPLEKYDSQYEYRCTPEDYAHGARESYTENAHMCHCRHNCTNYDELIKDLGRDSIAGRVYYTAIHARIMEMLEEAIDSLPDEEEDDDESLDIEPPTS